MIIALKIEDAKAEIGEFAVPEMSLSSARAQMDRKLFQMEIGSSDLLSLLVEDYNHLVVEYKEDDGQCGPLQDELARAGYPELADILNNNELLDLVVGRYLFASLMAKFNGPSANAKYWHDEVVSCSCRLQKVLINGICYKKKGA